MCGRLSRNGRCDAAFVLGLAFSIAAGRLGCAEREGPTEARAKTLLFSRASVSNLAWRPPAGGHESRALGPTTVHDPTASQVERNDGVENHRVSRTQNGFKGRLPSVPPHFPGVIVVARGHRCFQAEPMIVRRARAERPRSAAGGASVSGLSLFVGQNRPEPEDIAQEGANGGAQNIP
jgi:hypothetical protein